ncbi:hypothetical protein SARC_13953 [Sphaeroforma arctica JP610]|uniref:Uncharacterized protein n=1 Tax=Sphaeroforma arctica JP610 TaxID=667725 RepID=A0A0L0F9U3_9EUKA|nr:hypothetical protein SARC_13953 [Sphaeroforma arctica JP610]KNC73489.1 hypothetical protein SARC_13953 [Sphaeroforma arctica JP610]|eukprot:XP_014147391.1 hypothetical protein SARC_13953 [Sphaeroforma arctica JP610]
MMDEVYLNEVPERPPVNVLMPVIKKKVASRSASRTSSKRTDKKKSDIGRLIQNESLVPGPTLLSTLSVMSAALSVGALVMGLRLRYHGA